MTMAMEHCDDTVMEHCDEKNSGALYFVPTFPKKQNYFFGECAYV